MLSNGINNCHDVKYDINTFFGDIVSYFEYISLILFAGIIIFWIVKNFKGFSKDSKKLTIAFAITIILGINFFIIFLYYSGYLFNSIEGFSIFFYFFIVLIIISGIIFLYYVIKKIINFKVFIKFIKSKIKVIFLLIILLLFYFFSFNLINKIFPGVLLKTEIRKECGHDFMVLKPVIYLYPEKKEKIKVKLDYNGKIIADYPKYDEKIKGWEVEAFPDGKIIHKGEEYSYLFWEGKPKEKIDWDLNSGFIVSREKIKEFFREKLSYLGLTAKEYNEFIVYWYPIMMKNDYTLVHFAGKKYVENAKLIIEPKPDSVLRVFMLIKGVSENTKIKEQKLKKFDRKGFSVVEWGGSDLDKK